MDKHLSGEVEASLCIWNKKDKSGIPIPEHNNLYAVDGTPITELGIEEDTIIIFPSFFFNIIGKNNFVVIITEVPRTLIKFSSSSILVS